MQLFLLEVKRVLKTRTTWILLLASLLLTMVLAYLPTTFHSYHWPNQNGQQIEIKGREVIQYKKDTGAQYSGPVTGEIVRKALEEYQSVMNEWGADEYSLPDDVYMTRIFPLQGIMHGLKEIFADPNTGLAPELMEIDPQELEEYYERCDSRLVSLMELEQKDYPSAQAFAAEAYSKAEKPYEFYPGYSSDAMDYQVLVSVMVLIFCCIICAPIFTSAYQTGEDDILRCTKYGRHRLAIVKIFSALSISLIMFAVCSMVYILISDALYGWETTETSIQMLYSITTLETGNIGDLQVRTALRTVLPLLASVSAVLLISAKSGNNAVSMALSILVCLLPNFLSGFLWNEPGRWILFSLPSSAFGMQTNMLESAVGFEFLHLGNLSFRPVSVMLLFCAIEIPLFIFLAIHTYSKNNR